VLTSSSSSSSHQAIASTPSAPRPTGAVTTGSTAGADIMSCDMALSLNDHDPLCNRSIPHKSVLPATGSYSEQGLPACAPCRHPETPSVQHHVPCSAREYQELSAVNVAGAEIDTACTKTHLICIVLATCVICNPLELSQARFFFVTRGSATLLAGHHKHG
jgi:hypothetical protein